MSHARGPPQNQVIPIELLAPIEDRLPRDQDFHAFEYRPLGRHA